MPDVPPPEPVRPETYLASWIRENDGADDQTLEENWLFRLRRERFRSRRSGQSHNYYVMHLADAVNVIALTADRHVVLVRQFRAGSGADSLETPGGLLEPGEDPCDAGARELLEETGYAGDPAELLTTVYSNPSIMTSRTTFILIENARKVSAIKLDHGEEVSTELVDERNVPRLLRSGRIDHALVVCGLLWWLESRFPGPLGAPAPKKPLSIGTIMIAILVVAITFGLVLQSGAVVVGGFIIVVILAAVIGTGVAAFDRHEPG